ncbi:MAG: SpvB/TcaC N-terminal domain-containing protein [Polyangiaceae bacterium]
MRHIRSIVALVLSVFGALGDPAAALAQVASPTQTSAFGDSSASAQAFGTASSSSEGQSRPSEDSNSTAAGGVTLPTPDSNVTIGSQSISLPSGAGSPLGMGESFSAQLSTGLATYTVPIGLPKARGNAQPNLVLSYSSSGGAGVAGVGWSIGGAAIARKTDHGLPKYDDRSTWHPNQDRFTFGGAELVPICLVVGGTCPGALSSKGEMMPAWAEGWQYFRTEIESSYYRFFWSPDHRTWRVQSKERSQSRIRSTAGRLGVYRCTRGESRST